jgi:hypothetical protein
VLTSVASPSGARIRPLPTRPAGHEPGKEHTIQVLALRRGNNYPHIKQKRT